MESLANDRPISPSEKSEEIDECESIDYELNHKMIEKEDRLKLNNALWNRYVSSFINQIGRCGLNAAGAVNDKSIPYELESQKVPDSSFVLNETGK